MPKNPAGEGAAAEKPFEESLEALEAIVAKLESGPMPIEEAMRLFEQGMKLSESCRKQLMEAEMRIEMLSRKGQEITPVPFATENE
jgi:exodeoxyribonuclease VII small subunit